MSRTVVQTVESKWEEDGKGARVRRSIGRAQFRNLDPFLMLDEFSVTAPAGFPDHPHRGFETVTYMLKGEFCHEDFMGNSGVIKPGDLQWMTAGRGIVHCEMPHGKEEGHGLQLWVNLGKEHKMCEPAYQELSSKDIPSNSKDGVKVVIIAGEAMGIKSPVYTRTPTLYLDFKIEKGAKFVQNVPEGWTVFAYILDGSITFGPTSSQTEVAAHHTAVFSEGKGVRFENKGTKQCHFVLVGGQPLKEPIEQHGPFVMNTQAEINQAVDDYRHGRNGFEKATAWQSEVTKH